MGARVALPRQLRHRRPSGIGQPQQVRHLVERLARSVIAGARQLDKRSRRITAIDGRVPARHDQGDARPEVSAGAFLVLHGCGPDVRLDVMDGHQRLPVHPGPTLGRGDTHEQRPDQARLGGDGDGIDVRRAHAGLVKRLVDDRQDLLEVGAAGELGDDAAVERVHGRLAVDDGGEDVSAAADDGCCGFVAGAFDAEE